MPLSCSSYAATVKILADGGVVDDFVITCPDVIIGVVLVVVLVVVVLL